MMALSIVVNNIHIRENAATHWRSRLYVDTVPSAAAPANPKLLGTVEALASSFGFVQTSIEIGTVSAGINLYPRLALDVRAPDGGRGAFSQVRTLALTSFALIPV